MKFVIPEPNAKLPEAAPPAVRQRKTKQALIAAGGKRIAVNLPAQAMDDLLRIRVCNPSLKTNSEAVIAALHYLARNIR